MVFAPTLVRGQEPDLLSTRYTLPPGVTQTIDGVKMKCFAGPAYATVSLIGLSYSKLYDWRLSTLGELRAYRLALAAQLKLTLRHERMVTTLLKERDRLYLRLNQSNDTINDTLTGFRYEKYALWAAIVIETGYILVQGLRR